MITARGDEADRVEGLDAGADDYVVKPFLPRELTAPHSCRASTRKAPRGGRGRRRCRPSTIVRRRSYAAVRFS